MDRHFLVNIINSEKFELVLLEAVVFSSTMLCVKLA